MCSRFHWRFAHAALLLAIVSSHAAAFSSRKVKALRNPTQGEPGAIMNPIQGEPGALVNPTQGEPGALVMPFTPYRNTGVVETTVNETTSPESTEKPDEFLKAPLINTHQGEYLRQSMKNERDMMYLIDVDIGGQTIKAVLDTGSRDFVVVPSSCTTCGGSSQKYNTRYSRTYKAGHKSSQLYYGSGTLFVNDAFDDVAIGPLRPKNSRARFWEVTRANMNIMNSYSFTGILGIGPLDLDDDPPGGFVPFLDRAEPNKPDQLPVVEAVIDPSDPLSGFADTTGALYVGNRGIDENDIDGMLSLFGIHSFSFCLGRAKGSPGYIMWNDKMDRYTGIRWKPIEIVGEHSWGVIMRNVRLVNPSDTSERVDIGCTDGGCTAIVDSGTSLITAPHGAENSLRNAVMRIDPTCRNRQYLPHLVFELGEQLFSLPPESYMGQIVGDYPAYWRNEDRNEDKGQIDENQAQYCKIAIVETSLKTKYGPLWILGFPFFKEYYVNFDTGPSGRERIAHAAVATKSCQPTSQTSLIRTSGQLEARQINASSVRVPTWVVEAEGKGQLKI